jgi:hypothetical protein
MSIRRRKKLKFKARIMRRKRRIKLKAAGKNPDDFFYSGIYVGSEKG